MKFEEALSNGKLRLFQWTTFLVCMLVLLADGIDLQMLGLVAPLVIEDWGIDRGSFGLAMSAALIGMAFGAWGGGWLGDRFGRRNSLALAAVVFGSATIVASTADTVLEMTAWRILGGLGFGAAFPNALALTSEWLPERWRSYAVATLTVGTPAGGAIAAAASPYLLDDYGWRGVFVFFGVMTLLLVVPVLALLRDSPIFLFDKGKKELAHKHARKVIPEGIEVEFEDPKFNLVPKKDAVGVFHPSIRRLTIGVGLGLSASTLVGYAIINWLTTLLTAAGLTLDEALKAAMFGGIASVAGAISAGYFVRHFGSRSTIACVGAAQVALMASLGFTLESTFADSTMIVYTVVALTMGILGIGISAIYVMMTLCYPQSCRSTGIGFGMMTGRVGGILASLGGGYVMDLGAGSLVPFFGILVIMAIFITAPAFISDLHLPPVAKQR